MITSYQKTLDSMREDIESLQNQEKALKQYPPTQLYCLEGNLVRIRKYKKGFKAAWNTKIIAECLAGDIYSRIILVIELIDNPTMLTPVPLTDTPLYAGKKYKSDLYMKILKTGKLPKQFF